MADLSAATITVHAKVRCWVGPLLTSLAWIHKRTGWHPDPDRLIALVMRFGVKVWT